MSEFQLNQEAYRQTACQAVAEGCVLIKNENKTLPLQKGDRVAVFGRMAANYYKSGLGSGGLVNTRYVTGILDALMASDGIRLDKKLLKIYEDWNASHPLDKGHGWGTVPWNQEEMPINESTVAEAAEADDVALVIIGRTAGEDQDNAAKEGSYLLTATERDLIRKVSKHFTRTAVLLNVGNIIDMNWVEEDKVPAVMYVWQGGQEGGNGVLSVLTAEQSPSGKLSDTIAKSIQDYPSTANFGNQYENIYAEDIYVGYRYFETFAKDRVLYPFGFGLSYTTFKMSGQIAGDSDSPFVNISATVTNAGEYEGKEVAQLYVKKPQGALGQPARELVAFEKTRALLPGESTKVIFTIPKYAIASFDDSGVTGHKNAYVLEEGSYEFYLGSDVRSAQLIGSFRQEFAVVSQLEEIYAPVKPFKRMKPSVSGNYYELKYEDAPLRTIGAYERMEANKPQEIAYTGDRGIVLADVYHGKATMDEFLAQLSAEDLIVLFRGEGMSSPKVTPGTGSAFGGLSENLRHFGIPAGCTTDGPSGIRMDCGTKAFSLPNGTSLGCTFNVELVESLYAFEGKELRKNRIDALLGPGLNIHRNPLCGRNFEYISEDPVLTGKMGAAMIRGLSCVGSTGTIKHFMGNNQEYSRNDVNGVMSQRAAREIYLKGFEISVREGKARSVMTTYGPVNGIWTSSHYDLNTIVLRKEWGFDGIVMTDWWARGSVENQPGDRKCRAAMIAAGNNLYMVVDDQTDMKQDDILAAYQSGELTLGQLQENARSILGFLLKSPAMLYEMNEISQEELDERAIVEEGDIDFENIITYDSDEEGTLRIENPNWNPQQGDFEVFATNIQRKGMYNIRITAHSDLNDLAQLPISVSFDNQLRGILTFQGSNGAKVTKEMEISEVFAPTHYVKLYFGASGMVIDSVEIYWAHSIKAPFDDVEE
ncbi:MAG: glycoside hydrolase family 3 C-terminal domain-containing protein [Agathobacter sp.]|uniref:glycoside hydrolase family 3 protein n=1 Tax=Agathobacter sp. TaxID=2021311 RepID=UPI002590B821|nr:glycoside hydrolase family 3 protein [Agathobacter sp.]MCR5677382.1 glycoside hydrolase family 3 C-terminal domain-containing protein [Agathobacter sp.]